MPDADDEELTFQTSSAKEMAAFSLLRNLAYEAGLAVPKPHKKVPRLSNPRDRLEIVRLATPWFHDWPDGFAHLLEKSSWRPGYEGAKHLNRHALQLSEFPQVAEIVDRMVKRRAAIRRDKRLAANGYEHPERMSLRQARVELGVTESLTSRLVAAGVFGTTWLERERGQQVRVVQRKAVQELKAILAETLSLADASARIGLPVRAVAKLVNVGILAERRLQNHVRTARVTPRDLDMLGARLLAASRGTRSIGRARPLGNVIYRAYLHGGPEYVRSLFEAFDSGALPLLRNSSGPLNVSRLRVPLLELRRFYARVRRDVSPSA